jgi:hypothetical protein
MGWECFVRRFLLAAFIATSFLLWRVHLMILAIIATLPLLSEDSSFTVHPSPALAMV